MAVVGETVLELADACVATPILNYLNEDPWWRLNDLVREHPDTALAVLREIIAKVDDMERLASIGAGPIENLCRQHPGVVEDILVEARRSPNFRKAFRCVWAGGLPPETKAKVESALALYGGNL